MIIVNESVCASTNGGGSDSIILPFVRLNRHQDLHINLCVCLDLTGAEKIKRTFELQIEK